MHSLHKIDIANITVHPSGLLPGTSVISGGGASGTAVGGRKRKASRTRRKKADSDSCASDDDADHDDAESDEDDEEEDEESEGFSDEDMAAATAASIAESNARAAASLKRAHMSDAPTPDLPDGSASPLAEVGGEAAGAPAKKMKGEDGHAVTAVTDANDTTNALAAT